MTNQQREGSTVDGSDPISAIWIVNTLLRHRRVLICVPLLFGLVVGVMSLTRERMYVASASFVPQSGSGPASNARTLARQFGIVLGGDRPTESPEVYAELVRGRSVLRKVVETKYASPDDSLEVTLVEHYGIEGDGGLLQPWKKAIDRLREQMQVGVGRETGIIELRVAASAPSLAEQVARRILNVVNDVHLEGQRKRALAETQFVAERLAETRAELVAAEERLEEFLQQNRSFESSPQLRFEYDRLQREVNMRQDVYSSLAQAHEQFRIEAVRDIPVLTVIEPPEESAEPAGRGTVLRVLAALFASFALLAIVIIALALARRRQHVEPDQFEEFERLRQAALRDMRRMVPWTRSRPNGASG